MSDTAVAPVTANPVTALRNYLHAPKVVDALVKVLPPGLTPDRLVRQTLTLAQKNPDLLRCTERSILGGMIQAAELGLELSGPLGQAYLVPRKNNSFNPPVMEATFQVGFRGLLNLAFRSGQVAAFPARVVREKDKFRIAYGSRQEIVHEPFLDGDPGKPIGYYALCYFTTGCCDFEYMTQEQMVKHRARYAGRNKIWDSNFEEMALKTVIRRLCDRAPVSVSLTTAARMDAQGEGDINLPTDHVPSSTERLANTLDAPMPDGAPSQEELAT